MNVDDLHAYAARVVAAVQRFQWSRKDLVVAYVHAGFCKALGCVEIEFVPATTLFVYRVPPEMCGFTSTRMSMRVFCDETVSRLRFRTYQETREKRKRLREVTVMVDEFDAAGRYELMSKIAETVFEPIVSRCLRAKQFVLAGLSILRLRNNFLNRRLIGKLIRLWAPRHKECMCIPGDCDVYEQYKSQWKAKGGKMITLDIEALRCLHK